MGNMISCPTWLKDQNLWLEYSAVKQPQQGEFTKVHIQGNRSNTLHRQRRSGGWYSLDSCTKSSPRTPNSHFRTRMPMKRRLIEDIHDDFGTWISKATFPCLNLYLISPFSSTSSRLTLERRFTRSFISSNLFWSPPLSLSELPGVFVSVGRPLTMSFFEDITHE